MYWAHARLHPKPSLAVDRWLIVAGAIFGAMLGSKVLHVLAHLPYLYEQPLSVWLAGKSLLGGFLGGTLGVELAKRSVVWHQSTGDAWVGAITVGVIIGRLGCQVSGLWDQTYGVATHLPWGWDYGDGVARHPTALYEAILLAISYIGIRCLKGKKGLRFASLMAAYCVIRFGLEWLKPPFGPAATGTLPTALYGSFTAIQWAAILGLAYFTGRIRQLRNNV